MPTPRLGMRVHDIEETYGTPSFRVDYVRNGQQALREVYEVSNTGSFIAFSSLDGVIVEFENLGRMPGDASFQGR